MRYPAGETYALGFRAVQDKAPSAPGVYGIFTSRRWLHVAKSDDIRQSLFDYLNNPDADWSVEHRPLSFSFETAPIAAAPCTDPPSRRSVNPRTTLDRPGD